MMSLYCVVTVLLALTSQRIESLIKTGESSDNSREYRGAAPTIIEWMILCWVLGKIHSG